MYVTWDDNALERLANAAVEPEPAPPAAPATRVASPARSTAERNASGAASSVRRIAERVIGSLTAAR